MKFVGRYCINCGSELVEGSNYCPKCGNKVTNATADKPNSEKQASIPSNDFKSSVNDVSKEDVIRNLERLKNYFSSKETQYNLRNNYINYLNTVKKPGLFAWILGGGALSFVFYFLLFAITSIDIGGIGFFGVWIAITIGGYIHFKKKTESNIANTRLALEKLENELNEHYAKASNCIIAFEYSEPEIIQRLIVLLSNGRADTLKEAINVMLDDIHKQSMLNKQAEIAKNSKDSANAATATGLLVGISLLTRKR